MRRVLRRHGKRISIGLHVVTILALGVSLAFCWKAPEVAGPRTPFTPLPLLPSFLTMTPAMGEPVEQRRAWEFQEPDYRVWQYRIQALEAAMAEIRSDHASLRNLLVTAIATAIVNLGVYLLRSRARHRDEGDE